MTKPTKNKIGYYFLGATIVVFIILYFVRACQLKDIKTNQVVVVAYVESTSRKKNGTRFNCLYYYNKTMYKYNFSKLGGPWEKGDLIFFEISSANPKYVNLLTDVEVPPCITLEKMPAEGWKEIPTCP